MTTRSLPEMFGEVDTALKSGVHTLLDPGFQKARATLREIAEREHDVRCECCSVFQALGDEPDCAWCGVAQSNHPYIDPHCTEKRAAILKALEGR